MIESNIDYRLIFSLMSGRVSAVLNRKLNENFQKAGIPLSADQWNVIQTLSMRHELATQQQICDDTSFSRATITRLVNQLEEGLVLERYKSRIDWRPNYLRLTKYGIAMRDKAQMIASKTLREALRGLSKDEIFIAQKALHTVMENMSHPEAPIQDGKVNEIMKFFKLKPNTKR